MDVFPVELPRPLTNEDAAHVIPIERTAGEGLHDEEVFGGAEPQTGSGFHFDLHRPLHSLIFKRQRTEGDVDADALRRTKKHHTILEGKGTSIGDAGFVSREEVVNKTFLTAKTGEKCDVHILGEARLPPMLHGHATYDAKGPLSLFTEALELQGEFGEFVHEARAALANNRCCSTSPDHAAAGLFLTAHVAEPLKTFIESAVSAARMSASRTFCSSGAAFAQVSTQRLVSSRSASVIR